MSDAPKPRRRWLRFVIIAAVIRIALWLVVMLAGGGTTFDYDTF